MRPFVLTALFFASVSIPLAITACTSSTDDSAPADPTSEDELKKGGVGADCSGSKKCKSGLLCKTSAGSMPTGSSGKPVMGMPIQKHTCQKPDPGEEGSTCSADSDCDSGLWCELPNSGPPPGALGMPIPSSTAKSSSGSAPVMGMPVKPTGTCAPLPEGASSSGGANPPVKLGMPIHP